MQVVTVPTGHYANIRELNHRANALADDVRSFSRACAVCLGYQFVLLLVIEHISPSANAVSFLIDQVLWDKTKYTMALSNSPQGRVLGSINT